MSAESQRVREVIDVSAAEGPNSINLISVGGNDYYVHQAASHRFSLPTPLSHEVPSRNFTTDLIPCTVVNWAEDQFTEDNLSTIAANFASHDDVWNPAFLAGRISHSPGSSHQAFTHTCHR